MQIEEFTSTLEERGFWWQAIGFGLIGAISVSVLSIYSDSHDTMIEVYRLAATQVQWAFVAPIVATVERIRKMFEKKSEIRRMAREEVIAKAKEQGLEQGLERGLERGLEQGIERGLERGLEQGRQEGERGAMERFRSNLRKHGIQLTAEQEEDMFNGYRG